MTDHKAAYIGNDIELYEWCYPLCEIKSKTTGEHVHISVAEDAKALISSLTELLNCIPEEFGGTKFAK